MPDPIALPVHAAILPVPDGIGSAMRVSLQITPAIYPANAALPGGIALSAWPTQVAQRLKRFSVYVAPIAPNGTVNASLARKIEIATPLVARWWTGQPAAGSQKLWDATFGSNLQRLWNELRKLGDPTAPPVSPKRVVAPTIDSQTIAASLGEAHSRAAAERIGNTSVRKAGAAGVAGATEHWALSTNKERQARVQQAIGTALLNTAAPKPVWSAYTSYAQLEAHANGLKFQGKVDKQLEAAMAAAWPSNDDERLRSRLRSVLLTEPTIGDTAEEPPIAPPEVGEIERRKLAAILSHSTIAEYLGMIWDIEIPLDAWSAALAAAGLTDRGAIAVTMDDDGPDALTNWSAFLSSPAEKGLPVYFGPASQAEATGASLEGQKLIRGMLNPKATWLENKNAKPRFSLSVLDPIGSAKRQIAHAELSNKAGADASEDQPELGGRGIALIDSGMQSEDTAAAATEKKDRLHFAEELLLGYRPAVGIARLGSNSLAIPSDRWRSLIARKVDFDGAIDAGFVQRRYSAERENGHTRSPIGVQSGTDSEGQPVDVVLNHPEMFVWNGDSLAVSSRDEKRPDATQPAEGALAGSVKIDSATDLPVGITYRLPNAGVANIGLMPLRDGRRYGFGASAMFVNGCGLSVHDTIATLAADSACVIGENGQAFPFTRCERVPPPIMLLPPNDPLAVSRAELPQPGATITTMVLRENDTSIQRFLFPSQIAFEHTEQQGQFKDDVNARPTGAFGELAGIGAKRNRQDGAFPMAPNRRGPILLAEKPRTSPVDREYYPDGYTRGVWAHFQPIHPEGAKIEPMASAVPFRKSPRAIAAVPVMIEIKPLISPRRETGPRISIDTKDNRFDLPGLPGRQIPKISIVMAPATMAEIDLVADFDPAQILKTHLVGQGLLQELGVTAQVGGNMLGAALKKGRINELQGAVRLRIVHAMKRPRYVPKMLDSIAAVVVSVRPQETIGQAGGGEAAPRTGLDRSWSDIVKAAPPGLYRDWSDENGTTCFFVGGLDMDNPSTGALMCDAEWSDWGPDTIRRDDRIGKWQPYPSPQFARLFTINSIPSSYPSGKIYLEDLDLLPQGCAYSFRDGRARKLRLKLIGRSRFADYYKQDQGAAKIGVPGTCEVASEWSKDVWVPCNFRPPPPVVTRIMPVLATTLTPPAKSQQYEFSRQTVFRVELGDECYTTGEDEKIALVFHPNGPAVCDYGSEVLKPFSAGVTRWGRDPLHEGELSVLNITPGHFDGAESPTADLLLLPANADPSDSENKIRQPLKVQILPYKIQLNNQTGKLYIDIHIRADATPFKTTYMPFIQLGLARYQEHAVRGLELSAPVGQMVQVLPRRKGNVRFVSRNEGYSFHLSIEAPIAKSVDPKQTYLLQVTALRMDDGGRWVPQIKAEDGSILRMEKTRPYEKDVWGENWSIDGFKMRYSRFQEHLGVLIEEFEVVPLPDGTVAHRLIFGQTVDFGAP